jgi:hypothetical protein
MTETSITDAGNVTPLPVRGCKQVIHAPSAQIATAHKAQWLSH